jgi:hypothetical protein
MRPAAQRGGWVHMGPHGSCWPLTPLPGAHHGTQPALALAKLLAHAPQHTWRVLHGDKQQCTCGGLKRPNLYASPGLGLAPQIAAAEPLSPSTSSLQHKPLTQSLRAAAAAPRPGPLVWQAVVQSIRAGGKLVRPMVDPATPPTADGRWQGAMQVNPRPQPF